MNRKHTQIFDLRRTHFWIVLWTESTHRYSIKCMKYSIQTLCLMNRKHTQIFDQTHEIFNSNSMSYEQKAHTDIRSNAWNIQFKLYVLWTESTHRYSIKRMKYSIQTLCLMNRKHTQIFDQMHEIFNSNSMSYEQKAHIDIRSNAWNIQFKLYVLWTESTHRYSIKCMKYSIQTLCLMNRKHTQIFDQMHEIFNSNSMSYEQKAHTDIRSNAWNIQFKLYVLWTESTHTYSIKCMKYSIQTLCLMNRKHTQIFDQTHEIFNSNSMSYEQKAHTDIRSNAWNIQFKLYVLWTESTQRYSIKRMKYSIQTLCLMNRKHTQKFDQTHEIFNSNSMSYEQKAHTDIRSNAWNIQFKLYVLWTESTQRYSIKRMKYSIQTLCLMNRKHTQIFDQTHEIFNSNSMSYEQKAHTDIRSNAWNIQFKLYVLWTESTHRYSIKRMKYSIQTLCLMNRKHTQIFDQMHEIFNSNSMSYEQKAHIDIRSNAWNIQFKLYVLWTESTHRYSIKCMKYSIQTLCLMNRKHTQIFDQMHEIFNSNSMSYEQKAHTDIRSNAWNIQFKLYVLWTESTHRYSIKRMKYSIQTLCLMNRKHTEIFDQTHEIFNSNSMSYEQKAHTDIRSNAWNIQFKLYVLWTESTHRYSIKRMKYSIQTLCLMNRKHTQIFDQTHEIFNSNSMSYEQKAHTEIFDQTHEIFNSNSMSYEQKAHTQIFDQTHEIFNSNSMSYEQKAHRDIRSNAWNIQFKLYVLWTESTYRYSIKRMKYSIQTLCLMNRKHTEIFDQTHEIFNSNSMSYEQKAHTDIRSNAWNIQFKLYVLWTESTHRYSIKCMKYSIQTLCLMNRKHTQIFDQTHEIFNSNSMSYEQKAHTDIRSNAWNIQFKLYVLWTESTHRYSIKRMKYSIQTLCLMNRKHTEIFDQTHEIFNSNSMSYEQKAHTDIRSNAWNIQFKLYVLWTESTHRYSIKRMKYSIQTLCLMNRKHTQIFDQTHEIFNSNSMSYEQKAHTDIRSNAWNIQFKLYVLWTESTHRDIRSNAWNIQFKLYVLWTESTHTDIRSNAWNIQFKLYVLWTESTQRYSIKRMKYSIQTLCLMNRKHI